jgi:DNA-binding transcriptional MerR regulator
MEPLSIGQLAEVAGVHTETIRYYERRGLLADPPRTAAGYRQYGADDVWRLLFIARAKGLGFTLTEIGELLDADGGSSVDRTLAAARRKLAAVDAKLTELARTRARLEELVGVCAGGAEADCTALNLAG